MNKEKRPVYERTVECLVIITICTVLVAFLFPKRNSLPVRAEYIVNSVKQTVKIGPNGLFVFRTYDEYGRETEVRSQSTRFKEYLVWDVLRTVYDTNGYPTYRSHYVEDPNVIQACVNGCSICCGCYTERIKEINSYHAEYNSDGHIIKREELLGLVIGLDVNGRSYVKNYGVLRLSDKFE
jgi:hypothetical protein